MECGLGAVNQGPWTVARELRSVDFEPWSAAKCGLIDPLTADSAYSAISRTQVNSSSRLPDQTAETEIAARSITRQNYPIEATIPNDRHTTLLDFNELKFISRPYFVLLQYTARFNA